MRGLSRLFTTFDFVVREPQGPLESFEVAKASLTNRGETWGQLLGSLTFMGQPSWNLQLQLIGVRVLLRFPGKKNEKAVKKMRKSPHPPSWLREHVQMVAEWVLRLLTAVINSLKVTVADARVEAPISAPTSVILESTQEAVQKLSGGRGWGSAAIERLELSFVAGNYGTVDAEASLGDLSIAVLKNPAGHRCQASEAQPPLPPSTSSTPPLLRLHGGRVSCRVLTSR